MGRVRMPVCLVVGGMADWLLVWRVVFASPWFWIGVDWCADVCPNVASTSLVMSVRVVPQLPTSMFCSYCCCGVRGMQARRDLERLKASYMSKLELVEKLQSDAVGHFQSDIDFHLSSLLSQIKWKLQRTVSLFSRVGVVFVLCMHACMHARTMSPQARAGPGHTYSHSLTHLFVLAFAHTRAGRPRTWRS